jgi:hypothetical protein
MDQNQSSTKIRFTSDGDRLYIPVVALTTELYEPKFCYDYAYSQNGRYFTEENNGSDTVFPRISGNVISGTEVLTRIYLKNLEENSRAANVELTIKDLNSTAEGYYDNNLEKTQPNGLSYTPVTGATENNAGVNFHLADEMKYEEGVYSQFHFMPTTDTLDVPLNMSIDFEIEVNNVPLEYHGLTLTDKVPLCTAANFAYNPTWNIFNIEDSVLAGTGKYNLYTQTAKRPFTVDLVSYDPSDPTILIPANTFVSVEMIDAGGYHDVNISCTDPDAAITERVWVELNGVTKTSIDINQAISDGLTTTTEADFYATAKENAAYRITFLSTNDSNASLMQTSGSVATNNVVIDNYLQMSNGITYCDYNNSITLASQCANASSGMTGAETRACMECLFGHSANRICSRDNFAIRPEAFMINIYDNNQSVNPADQKIALPYQGKIAAGYNYRYDVNATSHSDNEAVNGYTQSYMTPALDHNITYYWRPNGATVTGCNDTTDKSPQIYVLNGAAVNYQNKSDNVGRYELEMRDTSWTKVDQSPDHHILNPGNFNLDDCVADESFVPANATTLNNTNIGCTISSKHSNVDTGDVYSDYNITVNPYDFNVSTVQFHKGLIDSNTTITAANAFVYQNNISNNTDDLNMSVRYTGRLRAIGADNLSLTNFVANCFSQDLNLDINTSDLPAAPLYSYRLREKNATNAVINDTIRGNNGGASTIRGLVTLPAANFTQTMGGEAQIELNANFDRTVNTAVNPIVVIYDDFNVTCSTLSDCNSTADLESSHNPEGYVLSDSNVTHIYGRLHTPRHRVADPDPATISALATIPLYYEFYCDAPTGCTIADFNAASPIIPISPTGLLSQDDVRWYSQALHSVAVDGNATATQARYPVDDARLTRGIFVNALGAAYDYDGTKGYPYKVTISLFAPDWLIYNRYDAAASVNEFELEYFTTGQWAGQDNSNVNIDANTSTNVNRRISW